MLIRTLRRSARRSRVAAAAAVLGLAALPFVAPPAHAALASVGAIDPTIGFPAWYADAAGTRLTLCVDAVPPCFTGRPDLTRAPAFDNLPLDGEAFYYDAEANIDRPGAPLTFMRLALEATYTPGTGPSTDQAVFGRVRFRIKGTVPGQQYTVTYPYGSKTFTAPADGFINDTEDIGCFGALIPTPCSQQPAGAGFDAALSSGIGNFLMWDPAVGPPAPAGYLGSFGSPHKVVGSPLGQNFFRIDGPNIGGLGVNTVQTDLFDIAAKLASAGGTAASPTNVNFGTVNVATPSALQAVTVVNNGTGSVSMGAATIGGANAADFALASNTCAAATLGSGGSCSMQVRFTPTSTGPRAATLTINDSSVSSPNIVTLVGTGAGPVLTPTPTTLAFASQKVETISPQKLLTVTNTGTQDLVISTVSLGGANASEFNVLLDACSATTLGPGASCEIDTEFAPLVRGIRSASLLVASNAPGSPASIPLTGRGIAAVPVFSPTALDFGNQMLFTSSAERTIVLTNRGDAPLVISGVGVDGGLLLSDFAIRTNTCTGRTLTTNQSCQIGVRFTPSGFGSRDGHLLFDYDAPSGSPRSLNLHGNGAIVL